METKRQFQNFALQKALQEQAQQATAILPTITLPLRQKSLVSPSLPLTPPFVGEVITADLFIDGDDPEGDPLLDLEADAPAKVAITRKKVLRRCVALALCLLLALLLYVAWHTINSTPAAPIITSQNLSNAPGSTSSSSTNDNATGSGTIQVYILGAVTRPGVYTLSADARVYQLLQAAGGPLPDADLVALNLAAKLTDGQEIYVLKVGEVPPGNLNSSNPGSSSSSTGTSGQLVNINTATASEIVQMLHVSAETAQKVISYRTQHGPYTSVNQLLQVISLSIYNRIKNLVTV